MTYHEQEIAQQAPTQQRATQVQGQAVQNKLYLDNEKQIQRRQTQKAEEMLSIGNSLIEQGDQYRARRAFENAYQLCKTMRPSTRTPACSCKSSRRNRR